MRRLGLAVLLAAGCIHGAPRQDDRAIRAVGQQEGWAQQAISTRPSRAELDAVRSGDFNAVGRARTAFRRLVQAIDRGTWIRNTASQLMVDDPDPRLAASFDRAGRLRFESIQAADEVSSALAEAKGGLSIADLQPGFEAIRKAQASEDRIARLPPRPGGLRLALAPLPVPRPFIASAARLVSANPELTRSWTGFPRPTRRRSARAWRTSIAARRSSNVPRLPPRRQRPRRLPRTRASAKSPRPPSRRKRRRPRPRSPSRTTPRRSWRSGCRARSRCARTGCSSSRTTTPSIWSIRAESWCGRRRRSGSRDYRWKSYTLPSRRIRVSSSSAVIVSRARRGSARSAATSRSR